jgi:hypothetical protein
MELLIFDLDIPGQSTAAKQWKLPDVTCIPANTMGITDKNNTR